MRRIIIAMPLLAGCQTTPVVIEPTPEKVAAQFEVAAFENDFGDGPGIIHKWPKGPLIAGLDAGDPSHHAAFLRRHAADLTAAIARR